MIYGPTNDNGMWRTRYSNKLYTFYGELDVVKVIKIGNCGGWDTTLECKN
jgi:purine-nucleoside phosphorylase